MNLKYLFSITLSVITYCAVYITELNTDVKSVKGEKVEIWNKSFKDSQTFGKNFGMEGAHMYKINGKYYITCPAGGDGGDRFERR